MFDDSAASIMSFCEAGENSSVRRGVFKYGDTMFNSLQIRRLLDEIEAVPYSERSPALHELAEAGYLAIRRRGYLFFLGD
ncbi:hypothetical protein [Frondihabitans australicus]|uniref:hypothetical protein n=1 Tax=Frondihabitans australicus TaxID=386892 RepID=UPI0011C3BDC7|nr:hypothetical protein [Frondihabitans australicus]